MTRRVKVGTAVGAAVVLLLIMGYAVACTSRAQRSGSGRGAPQRSQPASTPGAPVTSPPPGDWWHPQQGISWQWQLSGKLDRSIVADVYDVDGADTPQADVAALHAAGRHVICYLNAGAYEDFRDDRGRFPAEVLGRDLDGWKGERWLDIRRWDLLAPILTTRMQDCRAKGFDAVEPDNVDGFDNSSGFPITADDQLTFNRRVADLAHSLGLAVGLKNDVQQAEELAPAFDFAVNEECARYDECDELQVFPSTGKPVLHVEYDLATSKFCPAARARGFSSMRKHADLDAWRESC